MKRQTLRKASTPKLSEFSQGAPHRTVGEKEQPYSTLIYFSVTYVMQSAVRQLLRSYRTGPLPKPFKIIYSLSAWARILTLAAPEE